MLPWVRPAALIAGVMADVMRMDKAPVQAASYEERFRELVSEMITIAARRQGPVQMKTADWLTQHESKRYTR
jgi:hypothetical protein